jgi:hypothetical protein
MRWTSLIAAMSLAALAACGQVGTAPAPDQDQASAPSAQEAEPPPSAQPVPAPPAETAPPQPEADGVTAPAPTTEETTTQAPQEAPAVSEHEEAARAAPSPPSGPSISARGPSQSIVRDRVLTPVLVELLPTEPRTPRQNGSAAVLLADPASTVGANKNLILCQNLFRSFDQATTREVQVGVRPGAEGELELLRPIYWLTRAATPGQPGADRCPQRLDQFDYPRAGHIARKLGLGGAGPYLVIERHDLFETERVAAVIDLSRTAPDQIANAVHYFRDGFMQAGDVWNPQRFNQARARNDLIAFLGQDNGNFNFLPRLVRATRQVGCPLTNLLDICSEPG